MSVRQDFGSYREAIGKELDNKKNQIRNLIGDAHWQSDGEHKENILRYIIKYYSPDTNRIGKGFVCYPSKSGCSHQIDILVSQNSFPILYKDGDFHIVTPASTMAIIEVKTKVDSSTELKEIFDKLCTDIDNIRKINKECFAGLFVYEDIRLDHNKILELMQETTKGVSDRAINCVVFGSSKFIRFWQNGYPDSYLFTDPGWHSYDLPNQAQPYFIGNVMLYISPDYTKDDEMSWFTLPEGKEYERVCCAKLSERTAHPD
ncbi:MAG: DUF6602 domain-containing protein [Candidatus Zixiibacteriota bacterium]